MILKAKTVGLFSEKELQNTNEEVFRVKTVINDMLNGIAMIVLLTDIV